MCSHGVSQGEAASSASCQLAWVRSGHSALLPEAECQLQPLRLLFTLWSESTAAHIALRMQAISWAIYSPVLPSTFPFSLEFPSFPSSPLPSPLHSLLLPFLLPSPPVPLSSLPVSLLYCYPCFQGLSFCWPGYRSHCFILPIYLLWVPLPSVLICKKEINHFPQGMSQVTIVLQDMLATVNLIGELFEG